MRMIDLVSLATGLAIAGAAAPASAAVYLNGANGVTVAVGAGTSAGSSNNTYTNGFGIEKVIDAASASAIEFHDQVTHIWYSFSQPTGGLELVFDLGQRYDISTLHFWNYDGEGFDVDNIAFTFFDNANTQVGSLAIAPALGTSPGQTAQDIVLAAPLNVRFVRAFLTGTNGQVDFQNIGFTAEVSAPTGGVPEPATWAMMLLGFGSMGYVMRRPKSNARIRFA